MRSGFQTTGKAFEVMVQLGAILAILLVYFRRLLAIAVALPHDPDAKRFAVGVLVAFLPAAMIGVLLHCGSRNVKTQPDWREGQWARTYGDRSWRTPLGAPGASPT
jgi:undecaprenyl-diphosphatase